MPHNDSLEDRTPEIVIRKPLCWADEGSTSPDVCIERIAPGELNIPVVTVQNANTVYAGPVSGAASNPSFRLVVPADIHGLSARSTSLVAPGTVSETNCTSRGYNPFIWTQLSDGTYAEQACLDSTTTTPAPINNLVFARHVFYKDGGNLATQAGKNAFVSINHLAGVGTDITNQDRALWVAAETPTGDTATRFALEGIQSEVDVNGTPNFTGSPDGEVTAGSFQVGDFHTGINASSPTLGYNGIRTQYFREAGTGTYSSCTGAPCMTGLRALATNLSTVAGGSNSIASIYVKTVDSSGSNVAMQGHGIYIDTPSTSRFSTSNHGIIINDFGATSVDYDLRTNGVNSAGTASGFNALQGPTALGQIIHAASGYQLDVLGAVKVKAAAGVSGLDIFGSTSGTAKLGAAAAAGTPNTLLLPTTTASATVSGVNQSIVSDGASPQQTSYQWHAPVMDATGAIQTAAKIVKGSGALSSGTPSTLVVTLTGNAVFTSNATYQLFASDRTTGSVLFVTKTSGSSFTITGPNTVTDAVDWMASGN